MGRLSNITSAILMPALLAGCAVHNPTVWEQPKFIKASPMRQQLAVLPAPTQRIAVAVYGFTDQTGQFKPSETVQTLSRAVTQGATSILVKTLQDTGGRNWFQVIERERLDNVLRERAVIREMRASYLGEKQINPDALPPLLFAGVLLEGGIISYDSNTKSGGAGARFLGIGGSTQYREDTVTIYLRAVSVKTGEVLSSVSVRKSIAAVSVGANTFRFVDFKELLELETGIAYNEPDQIALTQAIEKATYALIMEGTMNGLWCMNTQPQYSANLLKAYMAERDSVQDVNAVQLPFMRSGAPVTGACLAQRTAMQKPAAPVAAQPKVTLKPAISITSPVTSALQAAPEVPQTAGDE